MNLKVRGKERIFWIVLLAAVLVHLAAYMLIAYPAMPQTVPTHWGVEGTVDGWSSKGETIVIAAMPLLIVLLMYAVPRLDPKGRNYDRFLGVYLGASAALTLFTVAVSWMTPLTAFGVIPEGSTLVTTFVLFMLAVLMLALGNYMPRVKPNYMFGIRTPWTLASEDNWRRTHRFAGPVFMAAGMLMIVAAALSTFAPDVAIVVELVAVLAASAIVGVYSYAVWRREGR